MDEGDGYVGKLTQQAFEIGVLRHENAKLRETLSILWFCQQCTTDCDDCKINDGDGKILEPCAECACDSLCDRIRELGVEV